jgi:GntR family transcriptional repressor for pyruvate dehydrogenase complex
MITQNTAWTLLEPIEQRTATEMVADRLLKLLSNGDLKPGDKLPPERELAHQLQVGRTTVREALKLLTLSGLLDARRGDGTYVNLEFTNFISRQIEWSVLLSVHEFEMIFEIREALEFKAARLAAERATQKEIEDIAIYRQLTNLEKRDFQRETELDLQFHNAIAIASQNLLLSLLMASLRDILHKYIYLSNEKTASNQTTIAEHEAIYKAIAAHDPEAAEKQMKLHLETSKIEILKTIGKNSNETLT